MANKRREAGRPALASGPVWGGLLPTSYCDACVSLCLSVPLFLPAFAAALGHGAGIQNLRAKLNTKTEVEKNKFAIFYAFLLPGCCSCCCWLCVYSSVVYLGALFSDCVLLFFSLHSVLFAQLNFNLVLLRCIVREMGNAWKSEGNAKG